MLCLGQTCAKSAVLLGVAPVLHDWMLLQHGREGWYHKFA